MNANIEELIESIIGCQTNCVGNHEVSPEELEELVIAVAEQCRQIELYRGTTITHYFGL